jgi:hypothetical protein
MILSKPIIMNEYNSNSGKKNNNEIININMNSNNKEPQILNANLLSKRIRLKLKSKEINNKNIKFTIFKIFNKLNKKYKTINTTYLSRDKLNVNNWYDIVNITDVKSEIVSYKIMIKGRISSRVGASRTKTYLYKTNTKQLNNFTDSSISQLILKNGSTGIKIKIDSLLKIKQ